MKFLFLLSIYAVSSVSAQDTIRNFRIDSGEVVWQKTFATELAAFDVFSEWKAKGLFAEAGINNGQLVGLLKPFDPDLMGAGFSEWTSPVYLSRNTFHGEFTISYTGENYIVTMRHMMLVQKYDDPMAKEGEILPIEKIAFNQKGTFSDGFVKSPAYILNYTMDKIFRFK